MVDFVRANSSRLSSRLLGRKTSAQVVPGLNKDNAFKSNDIEMVVRVPDKPCVLCVGSTGAGKSSTVSRCTLQRAQSSAGFERQTQQCEIYRPADGSDGGPVWVDTVGWEDVNYEDETTLKSILEFLRDNHVTQISAIIWNVIPNVRKDAVLSRQAKLIDKFCPGDIWRNVIIICKQSMKPEKDGVGAMKAAEQYCQGILPQMTGYRFFSDFDEDQLAKLESDADVRAAFNVKTNEEIRSLIQAKLGGCGPAIELKFSDVKCLDCGQINDARLLPLHCHMEPHLVHTKPVAVIHPEEIENYHSESVHVSEHPGELRRLWYGPLIRRKGKRYRCCNRRAGKPGCAIKWACCGQKVAGDGLYVIDPNDLGGCKRRFKCCQQDPDRAEEGCQPRFTCCGARPDGEGCVKQCKKCDGLWGSKAKECFRKEHNTVETWEEEEENREEDMDDFFVSFIQKEEEKVRYVLGLPPIVLLKPF